MAKNKVMIDVVVDDKGTTKRVAVSAKKLGIELDKTGNSARNADRQLKGTAQTSANTTKNFSKMTQGIAGGIVPAYAAFGKDGLFPPTLPPAAPGPLDPVLAGCPEPFPPPAPTKPSPVLGLPELPLLELKASGPPEPADPPAPIVIGKATGTEGIECPGAAKGVAQ